MLTPWITPVSIVAPVSQSVVTGGVVTVSVAASGNPLPFGYQWLRSGVTIASNTFSERTNFFSFVNTNAIGSAITYRSVVRSVSGFVQQNFVITTLADTDGDGIADNWENQYGLNAGSAADRNLDADGDGASNWQEYSAGTNPTNNADALRVALTITNAQPLLSFQAVSNLTYTVQYKDDLDSAWLKFADVLARTTNYTLEFTDPLWTTNRFYRVVTPRQP